MDSRKTVLCFTYIYYIYYILLNMYRKPDVASRKLFVASRKPWFPPGNHCFGRCARLCQIFSIKVLFFVECAPLKFRLFWKILPGAAHCVQLRRRPHLASAGSTALSIPYRTQLQRRLRPSSRRSPCCSSCTRASRSSHRKWPRDER